MFSDIIYRLKRSTKTIAKFASTLLYIRENFFAKDLLANISYIQRKNFAIDLLQNL